MCLKVCGYYYVKVGEGLKKWSTNLFVWIRNNTKWCFELSDWIEI
ncbi:hypothetical protein bcere0023_55530 [Bacillus cereus Rock4-2]|nr:hypothetical protein bcere0023_55530 [Bacillus cereus Rock4-2]